MYHEQTILTGSKAVQYRFDLLKQIGDSLTIYACKVGNVRNSAYQHGRRYGCRLSVSEIAGGCIVRMTVQRERPANLPRQWYAKQLEDMAIGDEKLFEWHFGRGRYVHPIIKEIVRLNKAGQRYLQNSMADGIHVLRGKPL